MEFLTTYCACTSIPFAPKSLQLRPLFHQSSTVGYITWYSKPIAVKVNATAGKGFRNLFHKKSKRNAKGSAAPVCPCGGQNLKLEYEKCCKLFHDGGAIEPDATTLMKARFTAYANGVVDYIVKTTHPQNPDFQGADQLADDVRATCARLLFTKLEILKSENVSENEGSKNFLVEKSFFLREGNHWLYKEKLPLTTTQMASTNSNFIQAELARKAYNSSRPLRNVK